MRSSVNTSPLCQPNHKQRAPACAASSRPAGQIIFVDTPGIHKPGYALNRRMMGIVAEALAQVDVVLLMRDVTERHGTGEQFALDLVKRAGKTTFLLLNKTDLLKDKKQLLPLIERYSREYNFAEIIPISAKKAISSNCSSS